MNIKYNDKAVNSKRLLLILQNPDTRVQQVFSSCVRLFCPTYRSMFVGVVQTDTEGVYHVDYGNRADFAARGSVL